MNNIIFYTILLIIMMYVLKSNIEKFGLFEGGNANDIFSGVSISDTKTAQPSINNFKGIVARDTKTITPTTVTSSDLVALATRLETTIARVEADILARVEANVSFYTPSVVNICSAHTQQMLNTTFEFPHKSCIMFLWCDDNAKKCMTWARERYIEKVAEKPLNVAQMTEEQLKELNVALNNVALMNVRCIESADFRKPTLPAYGMITATVPPGRLVKIFGWEGKSAKQFQLIGPGYTQVILNFYPHAIWSGLKANDKDFPDTMNMAAKKWE